MKKSKLLFHIALACLMAATAFSCSKEKSPNSIKAQAQAMEAAIELAKINPSDTLAVQNELLKSEAMRSAYAMAGDSAAMADFDQTFKETLVEKSPNMANILFSKKN